MPQGELDNERPTKILVIGPPQWSFSSEGYRVYYRPWDSYHAGAALGDFDVVIIDFLTKPPAFADPQFSAVFSPRVLSDIAGHGGQLIILGDPRREVRSYGGVRRAFLQFTGLVFAWSEGSGDQLKLCDGEAARQFLPYLRHIKSWRYSLATAQLFSDGSPQRANVLVRTEKLAVTRFGEAIASQHYLQYVDNNRALQREVGPLTILPSSDVSSEEALRILLVEVLHVPLESSPPAWLSNIVPTREQEAAELQLAEATEAEHRAAAELRRVRANMPIASKYLGLLFQMGSALERVVLDALRELGAEVTEPTSPGKEDGWLAIEVDGRRTESVLEIKATKKEFFSEGGLRQLLDWVNKGVIDRQIKYKPIFIGNNAIESMPDERRNPFGDAWQKTAALSDVAGLRTEDLYRALILQQRGQLDRALFWRRIVDAAGPCDLQFLSEAVPSLARRGNTSPAAE